MPKQYVKILQIDLQSKRANNKEIRKYRHIDGETIRVNFHFYTIGREHTKSKSKSNFALFWNDPISGHFRQHNL